MKALINSVNSHDPIQQRRAAAAAQTLFRSFPRDAQTVDAEQFLACAVVVLAHYPPAVMERVVHPMHGLPGRLKFIPTLAEIREACAAELEAMEHARRRHEAHGPPIDPEQLRRPLPAPPRANLFIAATHPTYRGMIERSESADARDFHFGAGPDGRTQGIWVPWDWHRAGAVQNDLIMRGRELADRAKRIRAEWDAMGLDPVYIGDDIVSPALAR